MFHRPTFPGISEHLWLAQGPPQPPAGTQTAVTRSARLLDA